MPTKKTPKPKDAKALAEEVDRLRAVLTTLASCGNCTICRAMAKNALAPEAQ